MDVRDLGSLDANARLETDLAIIGGGPAGLTIAREFFGTSTRVLILESGRLEENPKFANFNTVESQRFAFGDDILRANVNPQVRCRVLGGSSHVWAGKSAAFDDVDFAVRDWVPYSGWPFGLETLRSYLDRAAEVLNLGPNCYDDSLWELIGIIPPQPQLDPSLLKSFFWQFARSRIDKLDFMRFGPEFLTADAPNVSVLLNATVTRIDANAVGSAFEKLEVSTIDGARSLVRAKAAVLAASGVENPRLLLVSNGIYPNGLGNQHDVVGRFLMDHPTARIGHFKADDHRSVVERFGYYGINHDGSTHMYMHGLVPSRELQAREQLLHCAVYMMEERALDDPWDALKRLLQIKSDRPLADVHAVTSSPALLAKGIGRRMLQSALVPQQVKKVALDVIVKNFPNSAVREFQSRGLPHKLKGLFIDGNSEQIPHRESRITLSTQCDALGVPMARVNWRIDIDSRRSLIRLGHLLAAEMHRVGLPAPILEDWVAQNRPEDSIIVDMGHVIGTTRMSKNPKLGVVDPDCQVHGIAGLYVAGSSVFPTSGHANPTLMILSLAIRLADKIKVDLARQMSTVLS